MIIHVISPNFYYDLRQRVPQSSSKRSKEYNNISIIVLFNFKWSEIPAHKSICILRHLYLVLYNEPS
jgi:hypothetical protein